MSKKSPITCHVLDASKGKPASGVTVALQKYRTIETTKDGDVFSFDPIATGKTDADGRCLDLLVPTSKSTEELCQLEPGRYKIIFQTQSYFQQTGEKCFYPWVEITFELENTDQHYHIPLLLSPYSFTTYRGS